MKCEKYNDKAGFTFGLIVCLLLIYGYTMLTDFWGAIRAIILSIITVVISGGFGVGALRTCKWYKKR